MDKKALLIIDVQVGAFDGIKIPPVDNAQQLLSNIRKLLNAGRETSTPIIFIQDCGKKDGAFEKGTEHWQIHPDISPSESEEIIQKTQSDAFMDTNLQNILARIEADTIIICGLHSESCVTSTCVSALERKFKVILVKDGHGTISGVSENSSVKIKRQNEILFGRGAIIKLTSEIVDSMTNI
jgi:nicotinamidase-related amidase